jgi:hypothetical protein
VNISLAFLLFHYSHLGLVQIQKARQHLTLLSLYNTSMAEIDIWLVPLR